jgi:hypothetical protein
VYVSVPVEPLKLLTVPWLGCDTRS